MFTAMPPASAQRGNPQVQFEGQTIDEMIAAFMSEHRIPGMTLAIVQAPYIPRVVGYGLSDVEKRLLASPKTLWDVGQMTQAYTAVAIMQLVEAGKVKLDDPAGGHVHLPAAWAGVTVRQLLAHTSGLPDYTKQPSFDPAREYKPAEIIVWCARFPGSIPHTVANARPILLWASCRSGPARTTRPSSTNQSSAGPKNTLLPPSVRVSQRRGERASAQGLPASRLTSTRRSATGTGEDARWCRSNEPPERVSATVRLARLKTSPVGHRAGGGL